MRVRGCAWTILGFLWAAACAPAPKGSDVVPDRVLPAARPFPLSAVRLLDGPFRDAMERDRKYLLELDPDRLLHNFRVNAGLPSSAKPCGGWEAPSCELRGHFTGHYLSACALMFEATGDGRFRERAELMVEELARCQEAAGNGYLSAFPESFIERVEKRQKVWAPWYTLHKVLAGLLDVHARCGSARALGMARRFGDWAAGRADRLTDDQMEAMLGTEHGGINESFARLYAATGEERYLRLARRFCHRAVLDPLSRGEDRLSGLHANTQFPKVIGLARLYELTGDEKDRKTAEFFWDRVVRHHSYVTGGNSDGEHFGPPDRLAARLSTDTTETCNCYNMIKLSRHLFAWDPRPDVGDFIERGLYNQILASQDPVGGGVTYYIPLWGGHPKVYTTPYDTFTCCLGTGVENPARYGENIYFHGDDRLWVNLFIASELGWKEKGIVLRQETRFPEEGSTTLRFACEKPVEFALRVRHPYWAGEVEVGVNGVKAASSAEPRRWIEVRRLWKTGDRVEVRLPMSLRLEAMPDDPGRVAAMVGPLVLSGDLGPEKDPAAGRWDYQPVLITGGKPVGEWLKPVEGKANTFRTAGVGRPRDVTLYPHYLMHHRRYTVYWDLCTEEARAAREAAARAEEARRKALEARTIDALPVGDAGGERERGFKGENTWDGDFNGRKYRDARDGGWFSFDLKVDPERPVELLFTYWGSDAGRVFDILVDGRTVATETLRGHRPAEFFDAIHALPVDLTKGKSKITVKLQSRPVGMAGAIFDARTLRAP